MHGAIAAYTSGNLLTRINVDFWLQINTERRVLERAIFLHLIWNVLGSHTGYHYTIFP
jgi:hypothetical protein